MTSKLRKLTDASFLQCPACGHTARSFDVRDKDGVPMVVCSSCKENFHIEEVAQVDLPVTGFLCPICQKYVPEIYKGQEILCRNHPPSQEPLVAIREFHLTEIEAFKSKRRIIEVKTQKHKAVLRYSTYWPKKRIQLF